MRARLVLLLAATAIAATAAPAATAGAASRLVVRGAGFGHGVGLSQYGAYGFALQGRDHAFILAHYYTGTTLSRLDAPSEVRVLLQTAARVSFSGATRVAGGRRLNPASTYRATRAGDSVTLRTSSGRALGTAAGTLRVAAAPTGLKLVGRSGNDVTDGRYRDALEIRAGALGGLSAINAVDLENYVRGVVAGESPASWPAEALRAQAVVARTYAIATSKDGDGFDQYPDTRSQVYNGISGETPTTDAAVAATAREVVTHEGRPAVTYYFSTSGGRTENVENSFIGAEPQPYLTSVEDPFDHASPRHRWTVRMSLGQAQRRLRGLVRGSLRQIRVLRRGRSPRVVRAEVVGTGGRRAASGPLLRKRLRLFDTWASFTVITANVSRGDGSPARAPETTDDGTPAGGAAPGVARAARRQAGVIGGRVAPAAAGSWVTLERREGGRWVTQFDVAARAGGVYRAAVDRAGTYRVRFDGAAGPAVRVR